jgi:hypothetical protein
MYGKHFASMYEGSMVGSGTHVFAVMGYIIANQKPDPVVGAQVRLNATILSVIFGESEKRIQEAIDYLCKPDPKSTTPNEDGRRLIKVGQFDYRVVNAAKYMAIRNEEERREANRLRQAKHRSKPVPKKKGPLPGEQLVEKAIGKGADQAETDRIGENAFK